ncbi:MAG: mechanosensitive ion channel family protein [Candidatus Omnitrophica bacterium]|nr:mechanosensitive ion channel family protein [Candidatus Omnitrophota bacterium]MDD5042306.1 mechanosensitive ion channel family protein [Candidatus Omnitrophota bacterium]
MIQQLKSCIFWGNSLWDYILSLAIFLAGLLVVTLVEHVILKRLKKWSEMTATTVDDFIVRVTKRIGVPLAYFGFFYLPVDMLFLHPLLRKVLNITAIGFLTFSVVRFVISLINYGFSVYLAGRGESASLKRSLDGVSRVAKVIIWGLAIIFFLDNLGFKISALIAGLGIGGVAVALAAQALLGDLFSYFAILFDRPFELGDFIIIGDYMGTIEHVGIKTTRIRSLSGEQLVFSNTDLTNSRVRNYKRMDKRRVLFSLGVVYQTTSAQLKAIPKIIEEIIRGVEDTVFDRAHFFSYGDFSLVFEVVYYVLGSDYNKYMDIQQKINFAIKEKFEAEHIEFAYPTQMVYVAKSEA